MSDSTHDLEIFERNYQFIKEKMLEQMRDAISIKFSTKNKKELNLNV